MQQLYADQATWWAAPQTNKFLDDLAEFIQVKNADNLSQHYQTVVILPTRRNGRQLRQILLHNCHNQVVISPHITTLTDIDSLPFLINQNVVWNEWQSTAHLIDIITPLLPPETSIGTIMHYAKKLYSLLQEWQYHQLTPDHLDRLSSDHFAEHFQSNMKLFQAALLQFPVHHLPAAQRPTVFSKLLHDYPQVRLLIATESPQDAQTIDLLVQCHQRPNTHIFLLGFDVQAIADDYPAAEPYHPYYGFKRLLTAAAITVSNTPFSSDHEISPARIARRQLLTRVYNDDRLTHDEIGISLQAGALNNICMIESSTLHDEALTIAIILRQSLEIPEQRTALVTPDRSLAELVTSQLRRWDITIEDSAGEAIFITPTGSFLKLIAECLHNQFKPISFLALLKHPYFACQQATVHVRRLARQFEIDILRQSEPIIHNWQTWRQQIDNQKLIDLFDSIETNSADMMQLIDHKNASLADLLDVHLKLAITLATSLEKSGQQVLFGSETGTSILTILQDLIRVATAYPKIVGRDYSQLFGQFLHGVHVRKTYGYHPRLMILDPLQSQLQNYDQVILAGLNANTWPQSTTINDPWFSQEMRRSCGLPILSHQNGGALHNFLTLFNSPHVILSRAQKVANTSTLPSPWLQRLQTALKAHQYQGNFCHKMVWQVWQQQLDHAQHYQPLARSQPQPHLTVRPQKLSVTDVEKLINDPYTIYARKILNLMEIPALQPEPDASLFGNIVHQVMDQFWATRDASQDHLHHYGRQLFEPFKVMSPTFYGLYWPKFLNIATWIYAQYQNDRAHITTTFTEVKGHYDLTVNQRSFRLTAIADRIDLMIDGSLRIIDYKTGILPTLRQMQQGIYPQLLLEAIVAEQGQFKDVPKATVGGLEYWQLGRHLNGGTRLILTKDLSASITNMHERLTTLIDYYHQPESPYQPAWQSRPYCPYNHLARRQEWSISIL